MQIFPAIDLRGGYCVRLRQGDYSQETIFDSDPVAVAQRWEAHGAAGLHLIDLDGAKLGEPANRECIRKIRAAVGIPCQVGGGLRDDSHIEEVLGWGVERVILGTRALQDPLWLRSACERHPGKIVLGLDSRSGRVATHGWLETSPQSVIEVARRAASWPLASIVYTDILKDGMLEGPNFAALAELRSAVRTPVIASGGITTLDDIRALKVLDLAGCVIGRALYEGRLDLAEVVKVVQ
ncbi:MAG TPA: 1-(5-phosphoribosyl)-5-[(5-phosphoribosylamino)methylideneamino]imidazole-4-carboxamide isomerase [Gemmataceae bacterium]|jgi:phosphoribosylformimino-5-aminoimidazole carboxamide ribotide isomerase|nr:1-(5-phosphoribosyl)-5-[(5-phosphoribosylamino)methylideneamino]imidazole-4-carboxamide isomerase [Gemmataceae bacterium]